MRKVKYRKASFLKRSWALLFDYLILILAAYIPLLFLEDGDGIVYIGSLPPMFWLLYVTYAVTFEASPLQGTLGKKIMNLKVIKINGKRPGIFTALARNVGKELIRFTFGQGALRLLIPGQRQAVHDEFARCYVVEVIRSYSIQPGLKKKPLRT